MNDAGAPTGRRTLDHLSPVERTLLVTLIGRAQDARRAVPFLGDTLAAQVLERVEYDRERVRIGGTVAMAVAIRSVIIDRAVREFVAEHPDAVVVELGCGLETRRYRVQPGPGVDWYDVDFPGVVEVRRDLLPDEGRGRAHLVSADLTRHGWLDGIPADRPTIVVADGLVGFLSPAQAGALFPALTGHFRHGELVTNAYTRFVARMVGASGFMRALGIPRDARGFGFDDPRDMERVDPRLTLVEERFGTQERDQVAKTSWPVRLLAALFNRWKGQARRGAWVVRYRF
ncbi:class I SAM-dependent methyltransferase [Nocardiopsis sp. NPDC050513]|uniref:class I SAM-dependent methyltransferase n=1 Tax=Nocardiopsis sp. NPDC050513 TaxID=3364338 RepID=UPI0037A941C6